MLEKTLALGGLWALGVISPQPHGLLALWGGMWPEGARLGLQ